MTLHTTLLACPQISVVIPTCHRNDLLALCLDRLAPGVQTLAADQYEVIVSDDGLRSTARAMIEERYPWAQWVAGPRHGPAANRNSGAALARGEWLVFTDDDCLPAIGWLQAYAAAFKPGILVYEGKTTCEVGLASPLEHAPVNLEGGYLWSCNMVVHRPLFEQVGGFDEGFPEPCNEDVELRERLKKRQCAFNFVPEAVVDHPPRPQVLGRRLGQRAESEVRLWYALGNSEPRGAGLSLYMLLFRLRQLKQHRLSLASLRWLLSIAGEIFHIATHVRRWDARHRNAYSKHTSR